MSMHVNVNTSVSASTSLKVDHGESKLSFVKCRSRWCQKCRRTFVVDELSSSTNIRHRRTFFVDERSSTTNVRRGFQFLTPVFLVYLLHCIMSSRIRLRPAIVASHCIVVGTLRSGRRKGRRPAAPSKRSSHGAPCLEGASARTSRARRSLPSPRRRSCSS